MSVMRHRRTNATSLIVIVASSFVAQDPLVTAGERALGVLGYQVLVILPQTWSSLFCVTAIFDADVSVGSDAVIRRCPRNVRFAPRSGRRADIDGRQVRARKRHMRCSNQHRYSITSSARASSVGGTSRPSAFAVLRFITRSNFVGCSTGRSMGLVPLRIFPT